jgi:hypothetical protein
LCYTFNVSTERLFWNDWAQFFRQRGWENLVVALLDASGPLTILFAQILQVFTPFAQSRQLQAFSELMENPDESREFIRFLRQGEVNP